MATIRKSELAAFRASLEKVNALIAAAEGNPSRCAVFHDSPFRASFTDEQKTEVRLYVETWIAEPLRAALAGIDGARDWANESALANYEV